MMFKSIFIFMKLLLLVTTICTEVKKTSDSIAWKKKIHYTKQCVGDSCYFPFKSHSVILVLNSIFFCLPFNTDEGGIARPSEAELLVLYTFSLLILYNNLFFSKRTRQHTIFNLPVETLMNNVRTSQ